MGDQEALTEADIDAMPLGDLYITLRDYGVNCGHLSPVEAKTALKEKIRELTEEAEKARSPEQVAEMMASVAESHRARRELLLQRCQDVIAYLPNLDQSDREKLTMRFRRDIMEILANVQDQLSKDDCPILIAGETSAGKSTLLNLLLGDDILPVAHMSSTSTICELKFGETRQAVVHLREPDPVTGSHRITLSADPEECRQQLEPHIHLKATERETLPPATKIEIFWPLTFLKGGVTIVDSPGVGESDRMDDVIAKYIPSAFAFIYIIDSSRAGGVQQDRLGRLLQKCMDQCPRSEMEKFDPTKAIFVCNKWDLVPVEERQVVKEETIRKLGEMWEGLDESQVFFYSNKEANKGGFRSADFTKLLDGIYELLPQSLNHKLSVQYRRLIHILQEALKFVQLKLNNGYRDPDAGGSEEALSRFDESTALILNKTRVFLEDAVDLGALLILTELLHGDELKQHLFKVPIKAGDEEGAVEELTSEAERYLASHHKFQDHVKATSQEFHVMFQKVFNTVSHEYNKNIKSNKGNYSLLMGSLSAILLYGTFGPFFSVMPFMLPFALGSVLATMLVIHDEVKEHARSCRSQLIDKVIIAMEKNKRLHAIARDSLRSSFEVLTDFESDLQASKDLVQRLMEERVSETRSQSELDRTYQPQASGITQQLGRLAMVELGEMREYEFDLDSIIGWPDPQNRIGGGSYGEVYRVQVQRRDGSPVRAALKVGVWPYDFITDMNAWKFLTEEDNIRKLKGEHIVEYYGTACRREGGGLRLGLVMELCEATLADRIIGQRDRNPDQWETYRRGPSARYDLEMMQRAFGYIQDKAIQLCEGLRTIHDAGYIHRDLKLINILVTASDVVKLTDFGETKGEVDVTGTATGTATYAAPEVKERKLYDKSADIYSLGLILWEMWYGRYVWDALDDRGLKELAEPQVYIVYLGRGPGPSPTEILYREWKGLVQSCVQPDAKRRPTALDCLQRIRSIATDHWFPDGPFIMSHSLPPLTHRDT